MKEKLGNFNLLYSLGSGTMGEVFLGKHDCLDLHCAIKVPHQNLVASPGFKERFLNEARVLHELKSPYIVQLHEVGQEEETFFLVMDFVSRDGETSCSLDQLMMEKGGSLLWQDVRPLITNICLAMSHAHAQGIIHRDLKLSNVLLDQDGSAKVSDFGLATMAGRDFMLQSFCASLGMEGTVRGTSHADATLGCEGTCVAGSDTKGEGLVGTFHYMPPEVIRGCEWTVQGDIYSLGVFIYRLLTGRWPTGRWALPSEVNTDIPTVWDGIVETATSFDPYSRFSSMEAICHELSLLPSEETLARSPKIIPFPRAETKDREGRNIMLPVSAGEFQMGRPYTGMGYEDERPVHTVYLDYYLIGKYPVSNEEFVSVLNWAQKRGYLKDKYGASYKGGVVHACNRALVETDASAEESEIFFENNIFRVRSRPGFKGAIFSMAEHPVISVNWYGAVCYCNWLSEKEGMEVVYDTGTWERFEPLRNGYRLPTEAEWERAAAWDGIKHWRYGMLSDQNHFDRANFVQREGKEIIDVANPVGLEALPFTSPVGWYNGENRAQLRHAYHKTIDAKSPVGAYDMSGNVFEWCHDRYAEGYYSNSPIDNPTGPPHSQARVLRGGCWYLHKEACRTANRQMSDPSQCYNIFGFRLARTL
jgi:formylglycine-generating enzyme required for sulfatase activity